MEPGPQTTVAIPANWNNPASVPNASESSLPQRAGAVALQVIKRPVVAQAGIFRLLFQPDIRPARHLAHFGQQPAGEIIQPASGR